MIRPTTPQDTPAILAFLVDMGLFPADEIEPLDIMLRDHFEAGAESADFWLTDDEGEPVGVAYCAPERFAMGTWNLLLIAVRPDYQGQGRGASLLHHVEKRLTVQGERLLLVETSGVESFERTRGFYRHCGYEQEARIRDYYAVGDDKIVFRKVLTGATT